jgi:hypothetical protein
MVRPKLAAPQLTIAEDQHEYKPVTAAMVRHPLYPTTSDRAEDTNSFVLAFQPSVDEVARLADGEAIYVSLLTFNRPMQPIIVSIGAAETAAMYGVEVEA